MDKIIGYIYETHDYDKFTYLSGNRTDALRRKDKVGRSIEKIGYVKSAPIIVNEKNEIGDGQARYEYCKSNGLPIYYAVEKEFDTAKCIEMNISQTNWRLIDYIKSYAEEGNSNYLFLEQLLEEFPKFKAQEVYGISQNTIILNGFRSNPIKDRSFVMDDFSYKKTRETMIYMSEFLEQIDKIIGQTRAIRTAIAWVVNNTNCDKKRFKEIIVAKYPIIDPVLESAICRFLEQLSSLYNNHISTNKQIDFDARYKEFLRYKCTPERR